MHHLLPRHENVEAGIEGAFIFPERVDDIDVPFRDRVEVEAHEHSGDDEHYEQEYKRWNRPEDGKAANEYKQEEAADRSKNPKPIVGARVVNADCLCHRHKDDDDSNRPETCGWNIRPA